MTKQPKNELTPRQELCRSTWRNYVRECWSTAAFCALSILVSGLIAVALFRLPFSSGEWGAAGIGVLLITSAFLALQKRGTPWRMARAHMLHEWAYRLRGVTTAEIEPYQATVNKLLAGGLSASEENVLLLRLVADTARLEERPDSAVESTE